jgi:DME family drug/metabolite transporter
LSATAENPPRLSRLTQGYLICLAGTVLWSSTAVFIRFLTETYHIPSLVLAFWRDLFLTSALAITFLFFSRKRLLVPRGQLRFLFIYGFVLSIFNSLWTVSVAFNGAAVSTVLAYSSAAYTAVLSWRLFGEKLDLAKGLAVLCGLTGLVLVSGAYNPAVWRLNPIGMISGVLSGVGFAAYSLMGKEASHRSIDPWTVLMYAFGFAALFLLGYNIVSGWIPGARTTFGAVEHLLWLGPALIGWVVLLVLAIGPTVGGYGLYTVSLNYLPASVANLIATLEPVFTSLQANVFLKEVFTPMQIVGSGLILVGVALLRLEGQ